MLWFIYNIYNKNIFLLVWKNMISYKKIMSDWWDTVRELERESVCVIETEWVRETCLLNVQSLRYCCSKQHRYAIYIRIHVYTCVSLCVSVGDREWVCENICYISVIIIMQDVNHPYEFTRFAKCSIPDTAQHKFWNLACMSKHPFHILRSLSFGADFIRCEILHLEVSYSAWSDQWNEIEPGECEQNEEFVIWKKPNDQNEIEKFSLHK